jgi:hypothetical protein
MDLVDTLSVVGILLVLPMLLAWPFWLIAKVLGVRWRLVVRRDGKVVDQELVRGWSRSKARMAQIGASIEDGSVSLPATESEAH